MKNGRNYVTVLTNGSAKPVGCVLHHDGALHGARIWGSDKATPETDVNLGPRQTVVDLWR
jgi:hypothetical protein